MIGFDQVHPRSVSNVERSALFRVSNDRQSVADAGGPHD